MARVSYKQRPSPNSIRRVDPVELVVIHHGGGTLLSDLNWLCNKASGVSSHLYITREGIVYQLVNLSRVAFHAGKSIFNGKTDCNKFSIGIEMEHTQPMKLVPGRKPPPPPHRDWPALQLATLRDVLLDLMDIYQAIGPDSIQSHRAIAIPAGRKTDPADPPLGPEKLFRAWINQNIPRRQP